MEKIRLFHLSIDMLCIADMSGYFKCVNKAFERTLGYTEEEMLSKPFLEFIHPQDREATRKEIEKLANGKDTVYFKNRYRCRNGSWKWIAWTYPAPEPGTSLLYAVARDITHQKQTKRTLEKKNIALKELLGQIEREKKMIQEKVLANVTRILMPTLKKLRAKGNSYEEKQLELLERNLEELTSSFGCRIEKDWTSLTPKEIEICNMIKNGISNKEISHLLNISPRTIETHRKNTRKKLGLSGKKMNLVSYLISS